MGEGGVWKTVLAESDDAEEVRGELGEVCILRAPRLKRGVVACRRYESKYWYVV